MNTKIFANEYLNDLIQEAKSSPRLRQHRNIHQDYQEPCQRMFNAIEPGSYIRPHRHASDPRDELLIAVRGLMALIIFEHDGGVSSVVRLGTEKFGASVSSVVEIPSDVWHTVIALEPGSILLEIKAGPFDTNQPKDLAYWAPEDNIAQTHEYLKQLNAIIQAYQVASEPINHK